ncbi:cupin domain-containing protein [Cupriavidus basilensis]
MPGEVAAAHRHTASAFRFIMKGSGATTTVNGERYDELRRPRELSPSMAWHDHEYHGDGPMVWLDVLDISLIRSMHACFFEPGHEAQQAVDAVPDRSFRMWGSGLMAPTGAPPRSEHNPLLVYPAPMANAAVAQAASLPPHPVHDTLLEYRNPVTGKFGHAHHGYAATAPPPWIPGQALSSHRQQAVLRGAR